jgi:hypothetical protein
LENHREKNDAKRKFPHQDLYIDILIYNIYSVPPKRKEKKRKKTWESSGLNSRIAQRSHLTSVCFSIFS